MEASRVETDLPIKMADLDIMEIGESNQASDTKNEEAELSSRVLRKRKFVAPEKTKPTSNRRVCMKPRKHIIENANPKQIEALYLNKKVQSTSQTLETIFEEPKTNDGDGTLIGGRKIKRQLTFQLGAQYTKEKIKKRRAKIKKMLNGNSFLNRKKIPMAVIIETIDGIEMRDANKDVAVAST